jgi:hypothetical protein
MSETYAEMKARIKPERYEVVRRESGVAKMTRGHGTSGYAEWEEPAIWATVRERATGRAVVHGVHLNSLTLCIPEGPSGRFPRGVAATDEEIILATVGDEPIFDHYGQEARA